MTDESKVNSGDIIHDEYVYIGNKPIKLEVDEDGVVKVIEGEIHRLHENDE